MQSFLQDFDEQVIWLTKKQISSKHDNHCV